MMIRISPYRFAEKMRKIMTTSIAAVFLSIGGFAQGIASVGMDFMPLSGRNGTIIYGGYGFTGKWSASFSAGIPLRPAGNASDKEHMEHLAEFDGSPDDSQINDGAVSISLEYWPEGTYEGFYMGAGCRYVIGLSPECTIGIGYSMPVWKGLTSLLSYGTEGFRLGLRWTIKTGKK